jgi:glycogen(starch) synthase
MDDAVAYAGRVEFLTGVHVLIEAVGLISQRFPEVAWRFEIAGEGDQAYLAQLRERRQQLGITTRVAFLGLLQGNALSDLFSRTQVQVVPSLWLENLPNSLLEGYAAGVPAIGSDIGSLSGTIGHGETGYLFKTGDPQSLAATLEVRWRNRPVHEEMGRKARTLAATEYCEERHVQRSTDLFDRLIKCNERPRQLQA